MTAVAASAACRNHPEREAIGICVRCRVRICSECVTKVDGINYCVSCLAAMAGPAVAPSAPSSELGVVVQVVAAAALLFFLTLLTWGMVEAAMPGSTFGETRTATGVVAA